jgi:putative transposase
LAAFVGETVVIRYDPRDMAEIRVFHQDKFLCRAICPELADTTVSLQEVIRARNRHRRELQGTLRERSKMVGELLRLKRSEPLAPTAEPMEPEPLPAPSSPPLKRYLVVGQT